ncbi:MAG: bacillithiol biosynthesis deacetylase BshB1 [Ferruginibacter sp.]
MKIDVLAFGVHPDDVELSCSGVLMVEKNNGKTTGIIDLTEGELGTRGTAETRKQEAADSARILGVDIRENLKLADGFFKNDKESQLKVIEAIRKYKPEIVICNAPEDRHPDHGRSAALVSDAAFLSGLKKIETTQNGISQEAWRPKYVLHFIQDRYLKPDFIVDISDVIERKVASIQAFKTQFHNPGLNEPQTYISTPDFLDSVLYRGKMFGKMIGVKHAEGFISKKAIGIRNFDAIIKQDT